MAPQKRRLATYVDIRKYIHRFPTLTYNGTHVTCNVCNLNLLVYDAFNCRRHVQSKMHLQQSRNPIPYWEFLNDLILVLIACNIPFYVLDNNIFQQFWTKYVHLWKLPSRSQLRRKRPILEESVKNLVKDELKQKKLWITVEVTSYSRKYSVVNVLVRTLTFSETSFPFLLCCKRLKNNTNAEAIVQAITDAFKKFDIQNTQIAMLVTDGAAHMLEVGRILKTYFPNLLHLTCVLYAMHLVADTVRHSYLQVDSLVTNIKKVFVKSPKHIRQFKDLCPGIPLPTKWGTWLEAISYYNKYFENVKSFILKLNSKESKAIRLSQQILFVPQVPTDIAEICANYSVIRESIEQLKNNLSLAESLNIVDTLKVSLEKLKADKIGCVVSNKFNSELEKNPDLPKIRSLNQHICSKLVCENDVNEYFKFAKVTSLDVEQSFSKYTKTYSPLRRCLSESTLEGMLMVQIYLNSLQSLPVIGTCEIRAKSVEEGRSN